MCPPGSSFYADALTPREYATLNLKLFPIPHILNNERVAALQNICL